MGNENAMFANDDIVADLHLVVDLGASTDPCAAKAGTVNGCAGTDFDIVVELNDADLLDFDMAAFGELIAEAIRTNNTAAVNGDTMAENAAITERAIGMQNTISANAAAVTNADTCMDDRAVTDHDIVINDHARTDGNFLRIKERP